MEISLPGQGCPCGRQVCDFGMLVREGAFPAASKPEDLWTEEVLARSGLAPF